MEFTVETTIKTSAERLYNAWLDSDEHADMTGGDALITDEEDDKFTAWDGYIWGTTVELKANEYIRQRWRTADFRDLQEDSMVEIFFEEKGEETVVRIKHSNLMDDDDQYEQGWVDNYFIPMKAYFEN
ncbi:MAG: SRPBCC domain-containing protein [Cyclobacteriaceae bacterium]|nr:SRPBCC domain-containing protein [Cyclobacteriaceae bacterium HetDA_MAG_MS6]